MNYITKIFLLITFVILFVSCSKDENKDTTIPYASVKIDINLQLQPNFQNPLYSESFFSNKGGISYAGYGGVLAITALDASGIYAYDLCCPYESPQKNILEVKQYETKAKCPKCGSIFELIGGADTYDGGRPISGPSVERLKQYRVYKEGAFYHIIN